MQIIFITLYWIKTFLLIILKVTINHSVYKNASISSLQPGIKGVYLLFVTKVDIAYRI